MNELYKVMIENFSTSENGETIIMGETVDQKIDGILVRMRAYHEAVMLMTDTLRRIAIKEVEASPTAESLALETIFKTVQILDY